MRKKTITKIVAGACVVAMAVSFAACSKKPATDESTDPSASDVSEATSAPETTAAPNAGTTTAPAAGPGTTAPVAPESNKPTDTASAVKFYNDALAKKGAVTATVTREMIDENSKAKLGPIPVALSSVVPQAGPEFALTDAPLAGADLYALDASHIAKTSVAESGDNYVITFTLNDVALDASSKFGDGGYSYFLDLVTVKETVNGIGKKIMGDPSFDMGVKDEKVKLGLSAGTFVVTISKAGAISAATLSFTEDVKAPFSKPVPASAEVQGKGTIKFTVA